MAMASKTSTLTFKPWAQDNDGDKSLGSILARIQLDRGHFRDITEQSVQEEIAAEGALEPSGSDSSEDEEAEEKESGKRDDASGSVKSVEDLLKAKMEMMQHIRAAQDDIDYARDFISLLVSKDLPRQAASSIAPSLAKEVPMGTLGVDVWQRMPADQAREAQEEALATNARMDGLQKSAESILAAATRLEDNVRKETLYWNQILSVSNKGWNVSKMPGGQNRLGVRFGFNESAPEFARRGLAALNISADGDIALDARVGSRLQAMRATIRKGKEVAGVSKLPSPPEEGDTTLETRIRSARDSLFDEELYHEMIRESRILASIGVRVEQTAIVCPISGTDLEVSFDLVLLNRSNRLDWSGDGQMEPFADGAILAARLLLTQAHRDRLSQKAEIPLPLSEGRREEKKVLPILRPIMSFAMHRSSLNLLNSYGSTLRETLASAQIDVSFKSADLKLADGMTTPATETLIATHMQPWMSDAVLDIKRPGQDSISFRFVVETTLARNFGSLFSLQISSRSERYHFDEFDELATAAGDYVAAQLARSLSQLLGAHWNCLEREASLVRSATTDKKTMDIRVRLENGGRTLSLASPSTKIKWPATKGEPGEVFWEAGQRLGS